MSDSDLIRRGDAIDLLTSLSCDDNTHWGIIIDTIRALPAAEVAVKPEELARLFHETYEALATEHGYETRADTRQFDPASPNGRLMIAVCARIRPALTVTPHDPPEVQALVEAAISADNFMRGDKAYERSGYGPKLRAALAAWKEATK